MTTLFATSISDNIDPFAAGQEVAQNALKKLGGNTPDIAIIFASAKYDHSQLLNSIRNVIGKTPIIGCTGLGEFTEEKVVSNGVALALISTDTHRFFPGLGRNLSMEGFETIERTVKNFPSTVEGYPYLSAILLIDGLTGKGEETVLSSSNLLGPNVKFAGGAAGDDFKFKNGLIFDDSKAFANALSICLIASQNPAVIAVKHGHKPLTPPLRVTKSRGNIVYEIEGKSALEVWKTYTKSKILQEHGVDIDQIKNFEEFSPFLLQFEAGLMTGYDYKVRFPFSANPDGSLNFISPIIEGSVIKFMDSQEIDQILSAKAAAEAAVQCAKDKKIAGAFVFDCVCRKMILKDKFSLAIEEIKNVLGNIPLIGFETYGEIAMELGQLSGFHNTTTVIMLLPV